MPVGLAGKSSDIRRRGRGMEMESLADMVLGFFEQESSAGSSGNYGWDSEGDGIGEEAGAGAASGESRVFWESQEQLLQEALLRSGSTEARIRLAMGEVLKNTRTDGGSWCGCSGDIAALCAAGCGGGGGDECGRRCFLRGIAERLREKGYDSAVCRSKWQRSPDIPSGEHSFIDVVMESRSGKRSATRVLIEPSFRAEFEVARGSPEYNALVARLPEIFAGKPERLRTVVKIMCRAAKRCMKENRMHMGPWRKNDYMLSKWLGTCDRLSASPAPAPAPVPERRSEDVTRPTRPRASMLTFDLHRTAVEVV